MTHASHNLPARVFDASRAAHEKVMLLQDARTCAEAPFDVEVHAP